MELFRVHLTFSMRGHGSVCDILPGMRAWIDHTGRLKTLPDFQIPFDSLALTIGRMWASDVWPFCPFNSKPVKIIDGCLHKRWATTGAVQILDPHDKPIRRGILCSGCKGLGMPCMKQAGRCRSNTSAWHRRWNKLGRGHKLQK